MPAENETRLAGTTIKAQIAIFHVCLSPWERVGVSV